MGTKAIGVNYWSVILQLGRVSNLPTVWSNVIAGMVLSGNTLENQTLVFLLMSMSLMYVAGMFLNDAFDENYDAIHRPDRPIPAKLVTTKTVLIYGFTFLLLGAFLLALINQDALFSGITLAVAIIYYNHHHKYNPYSPVVMGFCRMLVYITAAAATTVQIPALVWQGALALLVYVMGFTYLAKREGSKKVAYFWPTISFAGPVFLVFFVYPWTTAWPYLCMGVFIVWTIRCSWLVANHLFQTGVGGFIAGISLLDALVISTQGESIWIITGYITFLLTLLSQRRITGT